MCPSFKYLTVTFITSNNKKTNSTFRFCLLFHSFKSTFSWTCVDSTSYGRKIVLQYVSCNLTVLICTFPCPLTSSINKHRYHSSVLIVLSIFITTWSNSIYIGMIIWERLMLDHHRNIQKIFKKIWCITLSLAGM